ncbi:hypothetical protein [Pelosinus propionicus]|uniref:Uncharacterized protein n=1 Tax=Pelosinus propionicus DSM 13327 TaxID=1123291 RepID=A0A1I4GS80_9FIRM|nr:hypothetical protein [Pelosinus propionicus]SFL32343.1 hypothetical protein SAMN04490355_1001137 [Pelosinus propionicus DSM 13327]
MDDLVPLLLVAIMYLVPAVWRRFMAKQQTQKVYVPEQVITPEFVTEESIEGTEEYSVISPLEIAFPIEPSHAIEKEILPWQGKLTENVVVNGVIFAEILQPPRAYRPFVRRMK